MGTPITLLVKRFSAARVLPIMAVAFGGISMLCAAATNFGGMMTLRVLLAVSEAACFPGVTYYLSSFYTRGELARRVGIFYAASSIAGAFGGLIAFGVFQLNTSLHGWQILFLVEGGFTLVVAVLMWAFLPVSVDTAKFLTPEERVIARNRLLRDGSSVLGSKMEVKGAFKSLLEWQTLAWFAIEFCLGVPLASVSNFLPQVVARLVRSLLIIPRKSSLDLPLSGLLQGQDEPVYGRSQCGRRRLPHFALPVERPLPRTLHAPYPRSQHYYGWLHHARGYRCHRAPSSVILCVLPSLHGCESSLLAVPPDSTY